MRLSHFPPSCSTFYRPQGHCEGHDLHCEGQGYAGCRSRSLTCRCHRYFQSRSLPRHATISALCPPSCDVTSASPVDRQPLPGVARCRCSLYDVTDDVRDDSRTNDNGRLSSSDVSEMTWPRDVDLSYLATPTRLTTQYSLPRY